MPCGADHQEVGAEPLCEQVETAADVVITGSDQLRIERRRIQLMLEQQLGPGSFHDDRLGPAAPDHQVLAVDVSKRDQAVGCGQQSRQRDRIAAARAPVDTDQNSSKHRGSFAVMASSQENVGKPSTGGHRSTVRVGLRVSYERAGGQPEALARLRRAAPRLLATARVLGEGAVEHVLKAGGRSG